MDYKSKYLKYKKKYLDLKKKQLGSATSKTDECPCLAPAGKDEDDQNTCYVSKFNEEKPIGCDSVKSLKQASLINSRKWYRKCNPPFDNHCPKSKSPEEHQAEITKFKREEERREIKRQFEENEAKLAIQLENIKINKTLTGRRLLIKYFREPNDKSSYGNPLSDLNLDDIAHLFTMGDSLGYPMLGRISQKKLYQPNFNEIEEMRIASKVILSGDDAIQYILKNPRESQHLRDRLLRNLEDGFDSIPMGEREKLATKIRSLYS